MEKQMKAEGRECIGLSTLFIIYDLFSDVSSPDITMSNCSMSNEYWILNSTWKDVVVACVKISQNSTGGTEEENEEPARTVDIAATFSDHLPNNNQKYYRLR
jgi:hypothetical protein